MNNTHLDLFSGIGGFALAAQAANWRTTAFSEVEPYAIAILKKHWPNVPNLGDIHGISGIRADLVTGGFPCQPYSLAGQRRGAADDRALWPQMRRVIKEARPRWVLAENVPGIISMELDSVLSDLELLAYSVGTIVVPACAAGARHRRARVWIVAHLNGPGLPQQQPDKPRRQSGLGPDWLPVRHDWREWHPAETFLRRGVHGIPSRAHRIRGLGNAIVPQVAEVMLRYMRQIDAKKLLEE